MHPIWFLIWAWEKAWSEDGLFPLIEHNQGAISIAALGLALWAFIAETRRANDAEVEATIRRINDRREAWETDIRSRAAAESKRRGEKKRAIRTFSDAAVTLIQEVIDFGEQRRAAERPEIMTYRSIGWTPTIRKVLTALQTIMPACPSDPRLLLDLQDAVEALRLAADSDSSRQYGELIDNLDRQITILQLRQQAITQRSDELRREVR